MENNEIKTSMLIGNGMNLAINSSSNVSWGGLLKNLQQSFNATHIDLENIFKPFPLSFEEILFAATGSFNDNNRRIKDNIARAFLPSLPNYLHERVVNSRVENILTTNYDYSFEKVINPHFDNSGTPLQYRTLESKHSIRRRCFFNNYQEKEKSIWHIHGEVNHNLNFRKGHFASESIQIGYDHYVEYLNEIQSYLKGKKYKDQPNISMKLMEGIQGVSWIDKFFTDRLIIFGFDLDFQEIDIWWLLNYRMKIFSQNPNLNRNELIYYQPSLEKKSEMTEEEELNWNVKFEKMKAKKDVLTSLGVHFEEILCSTYEEFYIKVFKKEII